MATSLPSSVHAQWRFSPIYSIKLCMFIIKLNWASQVQSSICYVSCRGQMWQLITKARPGPDQTRPRQFPHFSSGQGTCLDRVRTRTRKNANKSSGDLGQLSCRRLHRARRDKQLILDQLCCLGLREGGRKEENPSRRSGSLCKYFQIKVKLWRDFHTYHVLSLTAGCPKKTLNVFQL